MRQWLWLLLALYIFGLTGILSLEATDVAQLKPVEVVCVEVDEDTVIVRTDTEHMGFGENLHAAIEDLKASTSGYIFMETAEYILLGKSAVSVADVLGDYLRPGCSVCIFEGDVPLAEVAAFLNVHKPTMTLQQLCAVGGVPDVLQSIGGRLCLGTAESDEKAMDDMGFGGNVSAFIANCGNIKLV